MRRVKVKRKIGPNDPCPCGSGKKYKKCCRDKGDDTSFSNPEAFQRNYRELRKNARFKECIYPDHSTCSEKVIGAHSIQNNKILARIADNGKVYMPIPKIDFTGVFPNTFGRKEASVFTGFCGFHDKRVFQPIEDHDFEGTEEQIFLYTYRAFALEYHKKQEALRMDQQMFSKKPSIINVPGHMIRGLTGFGMAVNDFADEKKLFDKALLSKDYHDVLTSFVWEFDGFSNFAATGGEAPSLDFENNRIQDLLNPDIPVRHIYITVFPENEKTFCIISWLKEFDDLFSSIARKLKNLGEQQKRDYVNNTLPFITENIAIRPSSWEALPEHAKNEFMAIFGGLADLMEYEGKKFDRFLSPSFDLFAI